MQRHALKLATAVALALVSLATQGLAQAPATAAPAMPFTSQQPSNEWLAHMFVGAPIQNTGGETVGEVSDLMFDPSGRISTVIVGVGGYLGIGEKNVGVRYDALSFKSGAKGERVIVLAVSKESLTAAPAFKAIEKSTFEKVEEKAAVLGQKGVDKAVELKDQAAKKIEEMRKTDPVKK